MPSLFTPIATTVYDAQATNFNGGNADENVTYRIKGTNANKFLITTITNPPVPLAIADRLIANLIAIQNTLLTI
jgi:hypothetical protein